MSTTVEKISSNKVKLSFDIDAAKFDEAMGKAYIKVRGQVAIPGFRKGHAPRKMIENMYGEGVFYDEAFELIFDEVYGPAIDENKLEVVDRPQVDIQQIGTGKNLQFTCEVFVKPDVTLGEYKGVEVKKEHTLVTEDDVNAEIEKERNKQAAEVSVDDRAVAEGDTVNLDYSGSVDGVKFAGGTAEGQTLKIGSHTFIPGFEEQMVGMTVGEEKDLNVTFPEKYHAENLAGKNAVFHVKVNSITKTELPELDDDFAQDNGFDTFEAYKADVAKKLQEIADTNYDVEIENALIEKAVANAQMDIPAAMIDDQLNYVMRDVEYSMMRQGLRMEDYLKYTGQTREQMAQQYRGEAENRVKIQLVLEAIRKAENIEPTAEDIDEQSAKQAKRAGQEVEAFKANLTDEHKAYLSDLAAIQKVCNLMKAGATVVDKKPEEAAETAEETKTEE